MYTFYSRKLKNHFLSLGLNLLSIVLQMAVHTDLGRVEGELMVVVYCYKDVKKVHCSFHK